MTKRKESDNLLTTTAVSHLLGVAASTVRRHADSGAIPSQRDTNNHRLYRAADIERIKVMTTRGGRRLLFV